MNPNQENKPLKEETLEKSYTFNFKVREVVSLMNLIHSQQYQLPNARIFIGIADKFVASGALKFTDNDYMTPDEVKNATETPQIAV